MTSVSKNASTNQFTISERNADSADARPEDVASAVRRLELMFDYVIVEAAELRLPFVVYLLRMARSELSASTAPPLRAGDPRGN
jgi:hypothetical protein